MEPAPFSAGNSLMNDNDAGHTFPSMEPAPFSAGNAVREEMVYAGAYAFNGAGAFQRRKPVNALAA